MCLTSSVCVCEAADQFDSAGDSYLSALSPSPTHTLCLFVTFYHDVFLLQANLVAAFEQSLALMTARLQTLSVSSDQKVTSQCLKYSISPEMCHCFYLIT